MGESLSRTKPVMWSPVFQYWTQLRLAFDTWSTLCGYACQNLTHAGFSLWLPLSELSQAGGGVGWFLSVAVRLLNWPAKMKEQFEQQSRWVNAFYKTQAFLQVLKVCLLHQLMLGFWTTTTTTKSFTHSLSLFCHNQQNKKKSTQAISIYLEWQSHSTLIGKKSVSLTRSVSHSLLQVLCASTQRLGFISFGHIPAWEYRIGGKAELLKGASRNNKIKVSPDNIHIHIHWGKSMKKDISECLQRKISVLGLGLGCVCEWIKKIKTNTDTNEPTTPAFSEIPKACFPTWSMVQSGLNSIGLKVLGSSPLIWSERLLVHARVSCIYTLPLYNKLEKVNSISVTGTRFLCPGGSRTDLLQGGRKKKAGKIFKGWNNYGGTPACFWMEGGLLNPFRPKVLPYAKNGIYFTERVLV